MAKKAALSTKPNDFFASGLTHIIFFWSSHVLGVLRYYNYEKIELCQI